MTRRSLSAARALITGASSGIGRELARQVAAQGAQLLLSARREDRLRALADELRTTGRTVHYVVGDITEPSLRTQLVNAARREFAALDLVVNNAGVGAIGPFAQADPRRARQIFELNLFAAMELTHSTLPLLRAGRQPLVVNVGSILGHRAIPNYSEYCASKFALRGWSEALRAELASEGIGVLLVSPGSTESEFFDNLLEQQGRPTFRPTRLVSSAEVARQIVRAIQRDRAEIIPSWPGRLLVWANRLAPRWVDRLVARWG